MNMAQKPTSTYVQFSKRLTTAVAVAWFIFRALSIVAIAYMPSAADAIVNLQKGADDTMMVAIGFYCGNSVAEKGILKYFSARGAGKENPADEESSVG